MGGGKQQSANNGIGCGTVLFFIFLVLKLTHNIDWSWWWVTAPIWIPLAMVPVILLAVVVHAICTRGK